MFKDCWQALQKEREKEGGRSHITSFSKFLGDRTDHGDQEETMNTLSSECVFCGKVFDDGMC